MNKDEETAMTPIVKRIHHVAYRCKDALETARWYEKHLGMPLEEAGGVGQKLGDVVFGDR